MMGVGETVQLHAQAHQRADVAVGVRPLVAAGLVVKVDHQRTQQPQQGVGLGPAQTDLAPDRGIHECENRPGCRIVTRRGGVAALLRLADDGIRETQHRGVQLFLIVRQRAEGKACQFAAEDHRHQLGEDRLIGIGNRRFLVFFIGEGIRPGLGIVRTGRSAFRSEGYSLLQRGDQLRSPLCAVRDVQLRGGAAEPGKLRLEPRVGLLRFQLVIDAVANHAPYGDHRDRIVAA